MSPSTRRAKNDPIERASLSEKIGTPQRVSPARTSHDWVQSVRKPTMKSRYSARMSPSPHTSKKAKCKRVAGW